VNERVCKGCGASKPLTAFRSRGGAAKGTRDLTCQACRARVVKKRALKKPPDPDARRTCKECGAEKALTAFHMSGRGNRDHTCGACHEKAKRHRARIGVVVPPKRGVAVDQLHEAVHALLKRTAKQWTPVELADHFNVAPKAVSTALATLEAAFVEIHVDAGAVELRRIPGKSEATPIDIARFDGDRVKFGVTADNHLCSKYARMDVLNALFDMWEGEGYSVVYQLGNMIDGEFIHNKFDLVARGIEGQVSYFVENWPQRKGVVTRFITGDEHEGWYVQREGINIGQYIEHQARAAGRTDLEFLGHMEHDIALGSPELEPADQNFMRLIHAGGGSAYATSYAVQKIVESYQGGEKPSVLLVGHYHKAEYGYPREVHVLQAGCTKDQDPFLRKLKIQAHVGGWFVSMRISADGDVHRFAPAFEPFYDRGFYAPNSTWSYRWKELTR